jgi:hypothetical protein
MGGKSVFPSTSVYDVPADLPFYPRADGSPARSSSLRRLCATSDGWA